jgi:hypothetical protein
MQIHSIPKSPKQKAQDMELSDLHDEEFKILPWDTTHPALNLITNLTTM